MLRSITIYVDSITKKPVAFNNYLCRFNNKEAKYLYIISRAKQYEGSLFNMLLALLASHNIVQNFVCAFFKQFEIGFGTLMSALTHFASEVLGRNGSNSEFTEQ